MEKQVEIRVYGAEQICASCVNMPSSVDTCDWLSAAISRKYQNKPVAVRYIDIFNPPNELEIKQFAQKVIDEDLFYPVVTIEGKIIGEGNPRLKSIYKELEEFGYLVEENM